MDSDWVLAELRAASSAQGAILAALMGRLQIHGRITPAELQAVWRDALSGAAALEAATNTLPQVAGARAAAEVDRVMRLISPQIPEPPRSAPSR